MEIEDNMAISVNTCDSKMQWTEAMTALLLSEVELHQEDFNSQPQKQIWKNIYEVFHDVGYNVNADQCCSKWKSLKRKYTQIKDNNNRTGAAKQQWIFFNAMDDMLKTRPEIEPLSLASSSDGFRIRKVTPNTEKGNKLTTDDTNTDDETATFPRNRNRVDRFIYTSGRNRKSRSGTEPYWAQALREQRERHHKDNSFQKERFLNILEKLVTKD